MRFLPAWFRSQIWTRGFLTLVVLGIGLHFYLERRAERRWQEYRRDARERGVKLTLLEFAAPTIPAEENFANLPMLQAVFAADGPRPFALPSVGKAPSMGVPIKDESINWPAWQAYFLTAKYIPEASADPAKDVLRALDRYAPQFQEWSQWSSRPKSRFALDLKAGMNMPLPHLSTFSDAAKVFSLKARAHLALGNSAAACADFSDGLQAYRALADEPTLICGLVRISVLAQIDAAVGTGLQAHAWDEPELRRIDQDLTAVQIGQDFRLAMESERAFSNSFFDDISSRSPLERGRRISDVVAGMSGPGPTSSQLSPVVGALIPKRLFRDNELRQNHFFDEVLARLDPAGAHFDLDRKVLSTPDHLTNDFDRYYYYFAGLSIPVYQNVEERYLVTQIRIDETRVAIAMERYRLRHGSYPETLMELAPEFLAEMPLDVFSGQPYCYRRTDGGTFVLYSVGENRVDDHGVLDPAKPEKSQLDAIWLYAPRISAP